MSNRLDQEKEAKLQPQRVMHGFRKIESLGLEIIFKDDTTIRFKYKGNNIVFYPYSGWHQGKGIKAGRGLNNLLKQLV